MSIVWTRRLSQLLFLALFLWLCVVLTPGEGWSQWHGWLYNILLQMDPLVALATVLATGTLYAGLAWAGVTLLLTIRQLLTLLLPTLPLTVHPLYLLLALLCSALVGLAAGIAPALRAMRQDPVVALHGE